MRYSFTTPAAGTTVFGPRPSFANSILGPSFNYEKPTITFADGTALSPQLLAEVEEVTARLTENLDWQDGDAAVIDNTRVMHGRRAVTDPPHHLQRPQLHRGTRRLTGPPSRPHPADATQEEAAAGGAGGEGGRTSPREP